MFNANWMANQVVHGAHHTLAPILDDEHYMTPGEREDWLNQVLS
jgi:hypothetical protein